MMRTLSAVTALLLTSVFATAAPVLAAAPVTGCHGREHFLDVVGTGTVYVKPDIADLSLGVSVKEKTAVAARSDAAAAMTRVLAALKDQGLEPRDLQTRWVSLRPVYAPNSRGQVVGYAVQNQITARVRDIGKAGAVLDAAVKAGGDAVRLQGLSFAVSDPSAARAKARALATAAAQAKAGQYAKLLQITVGKPVRISESSGGAAPMPAMNRMQTLRVASAPTPIEAGEQEITVNVEIAFAIE